MKNLKNLIPFVASLVVSLLAIAALIAMVQPLVEQSEIIPLVADSTGQSSLSADSLQAKADSLHVTNDTSSVALDSTVAKTGDLTKVKGVPQDTLSAGHTVAKLHEESIASLAEAKAVVDTLNDEEKKKMVQIFESMDAGSAARIMNNMDDFAVRQVLTSMKRRQSAKILSELEPKHAAKILKGKVQ